MIDKISIGNRFAISAIFVFILSLLFTYFAHDKIVGLSEDQNQPVLRIWAGIYFLVQTIVFIFFFRKEILKIKLTLESIVLVSLLFMLIFTVLSEVVSRYFTVMFVVSAIYYGVKMKQFKPHPLFYFIGGYFIFQLIGLIWSIDFGLGFKFVGKGVSFILLPLAFSCFIIREEDRNKILRIFFRFLLVFILMGIIAYLYQVYFHHKSLLVGFGLKKGYFGTNIFPWNDYNLILGWGGYDHPSFISFILSLMYGVGFYLWKTEKNNVFRISTFEMFFYTIAASVLIIVLQSRIGMILMPFAIFVNVLIALRKKKKLLYSLIGLSVLSLFLIYFFVYSTHKEYFSDQVRMHQTEIMVSYIKDHYWTGTGTGAMRVINTEHQSAHNQIIGELFHLGIPGFIVFCVLMGALFYYIIKEKNYMLLYFFILYFLLMQIDMVLGTQKGITYFTLFIGLFIRPKFFTNRRRKLIHKHDSNSLSLDL